MNTDIKLTMNKLTGDNYFVWKFRMQILLERDDVWSVIVEEAPDPIIPEWTKKDKNAKAIICMMIDDKEIINTRGCNTSREMWECLRKTYEHSGLTNKLHLMRKLFSAKYSDSKNMREHINHIMELTERLHNIGGEVKDETLIAILLSNLPVTYDPLITAMEARGSSELTLNFVKERLLDESYRKESREEAPERTDSTVMYTSQEPKKCYRCGATGHFKRDCRQRPNPNTHNTPNYNYTPRRQERGGYTNNNPGAHSCHMEEDEEEIIFTATEEMQNTTHHKWLIDSGASSHLTRDFHIFNDYQPYTVHKRIEIANGDGMMAEGEGTVLIMFGEGEKNHSIDRLSKVMYVPDAKANILSVGKLCEDNYIIKFNKHNCTLYKDGETKVSYNSPTNIFLLPLQTIIPDRQQSVSSAICIHQWHGRMGHRDITKIRSMRDNHIVNGLEIKNCSHSNFCVSCNLGKSKQKPFIKKTQSHVNKIFQLIHTDLCGPIKPNSLGGGQYFLTITDEHSRHTTTRILNNKTQVTDCLIYYLKQGYNKFGYFPSAIQSDGGGEFENSQLNDFLNANGIAHHLSVPYTPEQNGLAERKNLTLLNMARCMILDSKLPKGLWGEAIVMATYVCNLIPVGDRTQTPFEAWEGFKPTLDHLRPFGTEAYSHNPLKLRHKLDNTSSPGILVGYSGRHKGYRIWNPQTQKITVSRSVTFKEADCTGNKHLNPCNPSEDITLEIINPVENTIKTEDTNNIEPRRSQRSTAGIPPKRLSY